MIKRIAITFVLVSSCVLGWLLFAGTMYGRAWLDELGYTGRKVANLNWCVFACLETMRYRKEPTKRQCEYATDYASQFHDIYHKHDCCSAYQNYNNEPDCPSDALNRWFLGCFNGVAGGHFEQYMLNYESLRGLWELDDYLLSHKYVDMYIFPSYVIVNGHCVLLVGFDSDDSYRGDGPNFLYYWDPDYNSMRSEVFTWGGEIEANDVWICSKLIK